MKMLGMTSQKGSSMKYPDDCDLVYNKTQQEIMSFYDERAERYDGFLDETNYVLHQIVAQEAAARFTDVAGRAIDLGSGSGKVGISFKLLKPKVVIDGLDFSQGMCGIAMQKGVYGKIHNIDFKGDISIVNESYDLILSAGAFTPNHFDENDFIKFLSLLHNGGIGVVAVKKDWFELRNFQEKIDGLVSSETIRNVFYNEVTIWDNPEYTDTAIIVSFMKL